MQFAVLLYALLNAALTQGVSTTPALSAPHDFTFDGSWNCAGAFRNGHIHTARYRGTRSIGNAWIELDETDVQPAGYVGKYLIGQDTAHHRIVEFDANTSGYAFYESAEGWQGDVLTLTLADTAQAPLINRFVYTVSDSHVFVVEWQVQRNNEWVTADKLTCTREASK